MCTTKREKHKTKTEVHTMRITFKTNSAVTTKSLTEWYFGKRFVSQCQREAVKTYKKKGQKESRFWQSGTGYLTITVQE